MPKLTGFVSLVSCGALLASFAVGAAQNQLIDDFWMEKGADRGPALAPPSASAARRKAAAPATPTASAAAALPPDMVPAVRGLPPDPGDSLTARIGPNDLVRVQVFQVEELSSEERVNEEGQIVMPLIGPVQVAGLTSKEAESRIAGILARDYLQNPQVDVYIKESSRQQITVMGSVKKPGVFPIAGRTTLLQAIALAEGADPLANEKEVIVFRANPAGEPKAYVVNLVSIKEGKTSDPVLVGEDRVVVPQSGTAAFVKGLTDTLRGFVHLAPY